MLTGKLNIDNSALMKRCIDKSTDKTVATLKFKSKDFESVIESHEEAKTNPNSNPHLWPEFAPVLDCLKDLFKPEQIMMSWYNITLTGGIMKSHCHLNSVNKVLVYYVNCNPSHPPLELLIDNQWIKYKCETGTWILFSNDTYHRADINTGSGDRISISINIGKPIL